MTPAKRIATAIARSGIYHKRTAVLAGVIALGCCIVVFVFDGTAQKSVGLSLAVVFGFGAFRSLRRANRYFGLEGSPVLEAITQSPRRIAAVHTADEGRSVIVVDADDNQLPLRVGEGEDPRELLEAFRQHAPRAKIEAATG